MSVSNNTIFPLKKCILSWIYLPPTYFSSLDKGGDKTSPSTLKVRVPKCMEEPCYDIT